MSILSGIASSILIISGCPCLILDSDVRGVRMSPLLQPQTNPGSVKSHAATPSITSRYLTEKILLIEASKVSSFIASIMGSMMNFTILVKACEDLTGGRILLRFFDWSPFLRARRALFFLSSKDLIFILGRSR